MTRSRARQVALQISFAASESNQEPGKLCENILDEDYINTLSEDDEVFQELPADQEEYIRTLTNLVFEHREELDSIIDLYSDSWKINRISAMTKEILRCAFCEILYIEDVPVKVAINEAVELSKRFAEPEASAFINGILGKYVRDHTELSNSDE